MPSSFVLGGITPETPPPFLQVKRLVNFSYVDVFSRVGYAASLVKSLAGPYFLPGIQTGFCLFHNLTRLVPIKLSISSDQATLAAKSPRLPSAWQYHLSWPGRISCSTDASEGVAEALDSADPGSPRASHGAEPTYGLKTGHISVTLRGPRALRTTIKQKDVKTGLKITYKT